MLTHFFNGLKVKYGKTPKWNFYKYLIAPDGTLAGFT